LNALGILRDRSLGDTKRNNAINELRAAHDPLLTSTLLALLDDPAEEERFRSFVAQHLGVTLGQAQPGDADRQRITDRLRLALTDRHFQVQREALLALVRVRDDAGIAIMKRGLTDPAWVNGRDLVVRCLFILDQRERIPDVRPLLKDQNVEVQIAAIYCLGQWKDEPSRLDIEAAAASSVVRIHDAAALALKTLGPSPQAPADKP
jgi:HEAT repeat protein